VIAGIEALAITALVIYIIRYRKVTRKGKQI